MLNFLRKSRSAFRRMVAPRVTLSLEEMDLGSPEIARDPFPHYEALRRRGPVHFLPRHGFWVVLDHEEAKQALKQSETFSNRVYAHIDPALLGADPPAHAAVRTAAATAFAPAALERLAATAEARAAALLRPEFDAVKDFAVPLANHVAMALLGFKPEDAESLLATAPNAGPGKASLEDLVAFIDPVAHRAGLYRALLAAGHEAIGEAEARSLVRIFWLGSAETTARLIVQAFLLLMREARVRQEVRDLTRLPAFIEEVVRLHPAELMASRVTTRATTLGGADLPAGALVQVCIAAANRDPKVFADPAAVRLDRKPNHLSFGHGVHYCIGAALGRQTTAAALRAVLRAAPEFQAGEPLGAISHHTGWMVHTPARLLMRT